MQEPRSALERHRLPSVRRAQVASGGQLPDPPAVMDPFPDRLAEAEAGIGRAEQNLAREPAGVGPRVQAVRDG